MEHNTKSSRPSFISQIVLAGAVSSAALSGGMSVAYPAVALPALQANHSSLPITVEEASWIASLPQLTMILGCLIIGPLLDSYGRRLGLLIASLCSLAGWVSIGCGTGIGWLYTGRLLVGLGYGLASSSASVLLSELSDKELRGLITSTKNVAFSLGLTFTYILGLFYKRDWERVAIICACAPGLSALLTLAVIPESRVWLASKKSRPQALTKLSWGPLWAARHSPKVRKPLIIMNTLLFLRQMSGTSVVLSYAVSMASAAGVSMDPYLVAVGVGAGRTVGGLAGGGLSSVLGRRQPTALFGFIGCLSMLWMATARSRDPETSQPLAAPLLVIYVVTSTIFSAIPQAMVPELFPDHLRGMASSLTSCVMFMTSFMSLKTYGWLLETLGQAKLLGLYACLSVAATLQAIFFLPETQGKTFQQIGDMFEPPTGAEDEVIVPLNQTDGSIQLSNGENNEKTEGPR